jgi:hypothetical protein
MKIYSSSFFYTAAVDLYEPDRKSNQGPKYFESESLYDL